MELLEACQPRDNSRPLPIGKGKDILFDFPHRNQNDFKKKCEFLQIKMKFGHMFVVDSIGRSGGLVLLWMDDFQVDIQNFSR